MTTYADFLTKSAGLFGLSPDERQRNATRLALGLMPEHGEGLAPAGRAIAGLASRGYQAARSGASALAQGAKSLGSAYRADIAAAKDLITPTPAELPSAPATGAQAFEALSRIQREGQAKNIPVVEKTPPLQTFRRFPGVKGKTASAAEVLAYKTAFDMGDAGMTLGGAAVGGVGGAEAGKRLGAGPVAGGALGAVGGGVLGHLGHSRWFREAGNEAGSAGGAGEAVAPSIGPIEMPGRQEVMSSILDGVKGAEALDAKSAGVGNIVRNVALAAPLLTTPAGAIAGHHGAAEAFGTKTHVTSGARTVENAGGVAGGVGGLAAGMGIRRKAQESKDKK